MISILLPVSAVTAFADDAKIASLKAAFENQTGKEQITAASALLAADPQSARKVVRYFNRVYSLRRAGGFEYARAVEPGIANALDILMKQLVKGERTHQVLAMTALAKHPKLSRAPLIRLLGSDDADARYWAVLTLNRTNLTDLDSELTALLDDPDPRVRIETGLQLSWKAEHTAMVADVLQKLMETQNEYDRIRIVRALRYRDPSPPQYLSILENALSDSDENVRFTAAQFLVGTNAADPELLLPPLREGLKSKTRSRRGAAAVTLGRLGEHAEEVLDELSRIMESDEEKYVRADCAMAICRIAPNRYLRTLPLMLRMIREPKGYDNRRTHLVDFVGQQGALSRPALVPFQILLRNQEERLRIPLTVAMMRIDPANSRLAVEAIEEWANGNSKLRIPHSSFKGLGEAARPLEPILTRVANDADHLRQSRAQSLLRTIRDK